MQPAGNPFSGIGLYHKAEKFLRAIAFKALFPM
jgi:hypothetical protein